MIKAAVTGNIAAGKSCAEKILIEAGFKVIDCDKINAELFNCNNEVISEIRREFGAVSKDKIAEIVFSDAGKRRKLESIMHKRISAEINRFFSENKNEKIVFVSAALLFEAGFQGMFDKIIFVSADENIRLERLMQRNNFTKEQALKRIKAQNGEDEKIKNSDFIIYNNSDYESLKSSVYKVIKRIIP